MKTIKVLRDESDFLDLNHLSATMSLEKFKLLCWKNFTLQKRHPIAGLLEILFPIVIVLLFSIARRNVDPEIQQGYRFKSFKPNNYDACQSFTQEGIYRIGVSPSSNSELVELVKATIGKGLKVEFFENSTDLEYFLNNENQTVAGVEFDDVYSVSSRETIN